MKNLLYKLTINHIAGSSYFVPFENRIFNLLSFLLTLSMPLVAISNFVIGLSPITYLLPIPTMVIFGAIYYASRFLNLYNYLLLPTFILCFVTLGLFWFISGGLGGSIQAYLYLVVFAFVLSSNKAFVPLLTSISFITLMTYLEYKNPQWVLNYENTQTRLMDAYFGNLFVQFIIFIGLNYIRKESYKELETTKIMRIRAEKRIEKIYKILREEEKIGLSLISKILKSAADMLQMEIAYVTQYDPRTHQFVIQEIYGYDPTLEKGISFDYDNAFSKYAFEAEDVIYINKVNMLDADDRLFFDTYQIKTMASIPVWLHGNKSGALVFLSRKPTDYEFDQNDKEFLFFIMQWVAYTFQKNNYEAQIIYQNKELEDLNAEMQKLLDQLHESERENRKLALVANETDNFVWIIDKNKRIDWVNKAFLNFTGYTYEDVKGVHFAELLYGNETNLEHISSLYEGLQAKKPFRQVIKNYRKNGVPYWVECTISPIFNKKGELEQYVAVEFDITDRINAEEETKNKSLLLTALSQAQHELLNNDNFYMAVELSLEKIGKVSKVHRAYYFETFFDQESHKLIASQRAEWNSGVAPSQVSNPNNLHVEMDRLQEFFKPMIENGFFEANKKNYTKLMKQILLEDQQICSIIMLPIFVQGHLRGYVGFDDCLEPRVWTDSEKAILSLFAENLAAALVRIENEKLNRELSYIAQNSKNGVVILTLKGKVEWVNIGFTHLTEYTPEMLIGETELLARLSADVETNRTNIKQILQAIAEMKPFSNEILIKTLNGTLKWLLVEGRPVHDEHKGVTKYISEQVDITSRKMAEQQILEHNKQFVEIAYVQSHEFKGPLARIRGLLFLIEQLNLNNQQLYDLVKRMNQSTSELNDALSKVVEKANEAYYYN